MLNKALTMLFMATPLTGGGGFLLFFGLSIGVRQIEFVRSAQPATGAVYKIDEHKLSKGGINYYPRVEFATSEGRSVRFVAHGINEWYRVGDSVPVLYNPQNPARAEIDSFGSLWAIPLIVILVGGVSLAIGVRIGVRAMRNKPPL